MATGELWRNVSVLLNDSVCVCVKESLDGGGPGGQADRHTTIKRKQTKLSPYILSKAQGDSARHTDFFVVASPSPSKTMQISVVIKFFYSKLSTVWRS